MGIGRITKLLIVASLALATTAGLVGATRSGERPACELAAEWVEANRSNLPNTLVAYTQFSPVYQRAIYGALPVNDRAKLWHEHFALHLAADPALTVGQRAFVSEVDMVIDSILALDDDIKRAALRAIVDRAESQFPGQTLKQRALFFRLGAPVTTSASQLSSAESTGGSASQAIETCQCSLDWAAPQESCEFEEVLGECTAVTMCIPQPDRVGCGPLQEFTCNGACK